MGFGFLSLDLIQRLGSILEMGIRYVTRGNLLYSLFSFRESGWSSLHVNNEIPSLIRFVVN